MAVAYFWPRDWQTPLDAALHYAGVGWKIFPCYLHTNFKTGKKEKKPRVAWTEVATTDVGQIKRWWTRWPDALIGHLPGSSGHIVVDIDIKNGGKGDEQWIELNGRNEIETMTAQSLSGGTHLWFKKAPFDHIKYFYLSNDIEVRSDTVYVILPSPGSGYHWTRRREPKDMPLWLVKRISENELLQASKPNGSDVDMEVDYDSAKKKFLERLRGKNKVRADERPWLKLHVLEKEDIPKTDGEERSGILHRMECLIRDLGMTDGECFALVWRSGWCKFRTDRKQRPEQLAREIAKVYSEETDGEQRHETKRVGKAEGYDLVRAIDIPPRKKDWLWYGHLLRGALELLTGIPGLGKSQVQISYIACVTTTKPWPDGSSSGPPASVIMLTAEDALDDEVIPRLMAAGADLSRVHILKKIKTDEKHRQFLLGEDLDVLKQCIEEVEDVALVTLDPITAYMGKIDSHKSTEVRGQLGPLKDLAEEMRVAFSAITHPPKAPSQKAIDHFIGSQAFIAAGRIGHLCIPEMDEDKEPTGRILFAHAKHNPSRSKPTYAYEIQSKVVQKSPDVIESPFAVFFKEPVEITADQAISAASGRSKDGERYAEQRVLQTLLGELLAAGPVLAKEIKDVVEKRGFTDKQLRKARQELKVETHKVGGSDGEWWLCLPGTWNR
jgi:putative DNA primase/helicase